MKGQSNNLIIFLSVVALASLTFSIMFNLGNTELTGLAIGTINVTVNSSVGVSLSRSVVNFTVTGPGMNRVTYTAGDLGAAPLTTCSSRLHNSTCGINVTNDGTVNINVTMQDTGSNIFKSGTFSRVQHFLFNVSVPISARNGVCPNGISNGFYNINNTFNAGFAPTSNWTPVNTSAITIICGLNYTNTGYGPEVQPDVAAIDFNITVPTDESAGTKGTTLEILGVSSGLAS